MPIPTTKFDTPINGVPTNIEVMNDMPWGNFQKLLEASTVNGAFNFNNFTDKLIEEVVVGGIDPKDRTMFKQLPTLEVTALLGRIGDIIPLETYFKNLKVDQGGMVAALTQQPS